MPEGRIQPKVGAERLLFRSPLRVFSFVTAFGSISEGRGSFMNSGSVRTAWGSALTTSGGTVSRINSGRVRRAS